MDDGIPPVNEQEYILGTHDEELHRLRFQHQVWVGQAWALFGAAGLRAGDTVLDLGCGPGFTSFELAHVVGPSGRVIARDRSPRFISWLEQQCEALGLEQIEPSLGPVEGLELSPGSLDAAYARWLLCWVSDPAAVLERVADCLRPGGALLVQDYLDWGTLRLLPHQAAFDAAVQGCLRSYRLAGGTIDIAEHLPGLAQRCGLLLERFEPVERIGRAGSLEWRWIQTFFASYLPKVVAAGLLDPADARESLAAFERLSHDPHALCVTPLVADIVLRKP